jgi:hypothetical protein
VTLSTHSLWKTYILEYLHLKCDQGLFGKNLWSSPFQGKKSFKVQISLKWMDFIIFFWSKVKNGIKLLLKISIPITLFLIQSFWIWLKLISWSTFSIPSLPSYQIFPWEKIVMFGPCVCQYVKTGQTGWSYWSNRLCQSSIPTRDPLSPKQCSLHVSSPPRVTLDSYGSPLVILGSSLWKLRSLVWFWSSPPW